MQRPSADLSYYGVTENSGLVYFPCYGPEPSCSLPSRDPTAKSFTYGELRGAAMSGPGGSEPPSFLGVLSMMSTVGSVSPPQPAWHRVHRDHAGRQRKTFLMNKQSCDLLELTDTGGSIGHASVTGDSIHLEPLPIASPVAGQSGDCAGRPRRLHDHRTRHPICPTRRVPQYVVCSR